MSIINSIISGIAQTNDTVQKALASIKEKPLKEEINKQASTSEPQEVLVDFSVTSKEVIMIREHLEDIPDIRYDKVNSLKDKINSNQYYISYELTAENILNSHIKGFY